MQGEIRLKSLWPVLLLFLAVSGILICAGIYTAVKTWSFETHASRAAGTVIENVPSMNTSENVVNYYPKIEFETTRGGSIIIISNSGANPPAFEVGQTIPLLYDRQKPTHAEIDSFRHLWFLTMVLSIIGAVFAIIGGGMLIYEMRRRQAATGVAGLRTRNEA
jgi:hypothetical protein